MVIKVIYVFMILMNDFIGIGVQGGWTCSLMSPIHYWSIL